MSAQPAELDPQLHAAMRRIEARLEERRQQADDTRTKIRRSLERHAPETLKDLDAAIARFGSGAGLKFIATPELTTGNPDWMKSGITPVRYDPPGQRR